MINSMEDLFPHKSWEELKGSNLKIKPGSLSEIQCMQNVHCSSRRERAVIVRLVSVNTQFKNEDAAR